jgi:hypothetical protein
VNVTKDELLTRIIMAGRVFFKNGESRPLRANETRLVVDAINSVWTADE